MSKGNITFYEMEFEFETAIKISPWCETHMLPTKFLYLKFKMLPCCNVVNFLKKCNKTVLMGFHLHTSPDLPVHFFPCYNVTFQ